MADMDRFEARFARALERYANEAPGTVDAAAVARTVAADHQRRGWLGRLTGGWWPTVRAVRFAPMVQGALAVVVIAALGAGVFALAERMQTARLDASVAGRMDCPGFSTTTPAAVTLELTCSAVLSEGGLTGTAHVTLERATLFRGLPARTGSMELAVGGSSWTGGIWVMTSPNGMVFGNARLAADSTDGEMLDVGIVGGDGIPWGLLVTVGTQD